MQIKNSLLLLTALTATSAVARLHGHDRRHAHVEKRNPADEVYATINGVLVSWVNNWSGQATAAPAPAAAEPTAVAAAPTVVNVPAQSTSEPVSKPASASVDWTAAPADGSYSREGFGGQTAASGSGNTYKGNVGAPWGSNIIEVAAHKASQYKHVIELVGSTTDVWTVVFWNKIGPDGKMTGWYGHSALTLTLQPGETKYVAIDDNSQGAWGAAKGTKLPTDQWGGYSCTWGEFDVSSAANNGWSGWDVSAIQAQNAGQEVQGMKICDHTGSGCSIIANALATVTNAYTSNLANLGGIGGSLPAGPVRLSVEIDFN